MTLRPDEMGAADVAPLLEAGVSEAGVVDALYVGFLLQHDRPDRGLARVPTVVSEGTARAPTGC